MIRKTAAAGDFYTDDEKELAAFMEVRKYCGEKENVIFTLASHAGYECSGAAAVKTISTPPFPKL